MTTHSTYYERLDNAAVQRAIDARERIEKMDNGLKECTVRDVLKGQWHTVQHDILIVAEQGARDLDPHTSLRLLGELESCELAVSDWLDTMPTLSTGV